MISSEVDGKHNFVTIMDDMGQDEDIILSWTEGEETFSIVQYINDQTPPNTIIMSSLQAAYLKDILNDIIIEEDEDDF
jgi:hypothetical protein